LVNVYLRHQWKNPPVKFGALQVGKVLSSGKTNNGNIIGKDF